MNICFRILIGALAVFLLAVTAFSQPEKGSSDVGLNGAVLIPHTSPGDTIGLVDLTYGYYFRAHDLAGLNTVTIFSKNVQDVYVLGRYRHLFSTGNSKIFPFVGGGGGINVFSSTVSSVRHWGLGSAEAGLKFFTSRRTAFEVTYDLAYVNVKNGSFSQNSVSAVTFGFTYGFGGKRSETEQPVDTPRQDATPLGTPSVQGRARRGLRPVAPQAPPPASPSPYQGELTQIAILGLAVSSKGSEGVVIVDVYGGSAADLKGIRPGDVINGIDGKPVKDAKQLAAELSGRAAGEEVRVAFMVRGYWQTEATLVLGAQR